MRILYGKGVWAWLEGELSQAIDLAYAIGARIIFFKTGQEGEYYEQSARRVVQRIFDAGLIPCAWPVITCHDPQAEAEVATQTILDGYVGLVFDIEKPASGQHEGAKKLGQLMTKTELPPEVMFFTSLPNISANTDIPYDEMRKFCRGGFMPQAYASFDWTPDYTLDIATYHEFKQWMKYKRHKLPMYPVLGFYRDEHGEEPLTVDEVRAWLKALARQRPTFFSVYRAGIIPEEAWPLLAEFETTPQGETPPEPPVEGKYVTVERGTTLGQLCTSCTIEQFMEWNGHLWDARDKPRDPRLLEAGWIVRIK